MTLVADTARLADEYERLCRTPSDIYLHLPRLVALVEDTGAQHVIELGTRSGVSTLAWLHALARTGGRLTSVDIDPAPDIGAWPHWTFIQSDDLAPDLLAGLGAADIVFIDTDHEYHHTLAELHVYSRVVTPGGYLVLHDTELMRPDGVTGGPAYPVRSAIEDFVAAEGYDWHNVASCWGLGIVRVA